MLDAYLPSLSAFSSSIDNLIWLVAITTGFFFILAELVFFWLIFRFAAQPGVKGKYVAGEDRREKRWVSMPHYATLAFDLVIIVMAIQVWNSVKIDMPDAHATVRIIAQQWAWTFVHPGPDGKLDTADDISTVDELHIENDKVYHFELMSRDVLHSFSVPVFRLKQDAIPGRVIKGWFRSTGTGQYDIQCTEICGIGHAIMPARIFIESGEQHRLWNKANAPVVAEVPAAAPTTAGGRP